MKRTLSLVALAFVLVVVAYALQTTPSYPLLDWARKASPEKRSVAVLLEFGHKDVTARDWSGQTKVTGARVIHREGYRFRDGDKLVGADGWEASSRTQIRAPKGQPAISKLMPLATVGIVLHLQDEQPDARIAVTLKGGEKADIALAELRAGKTVPLFDGKAVARLVTTATPLATEPAEEDFPAAAYGPDGSLWVAYISYKNREPARQIEAAQLKQQPADFKAYYKPEYADQLFVKSLKGGKWSEPIAVTGPHEDIARCAIAATAQGALVVYSGHRQNTFDLYARLIDPQGKVGAEQRLTPHKLLTAKWGNVLTPVAAADAAGNVWIAAQGWDDQGAAGILVLRCAGDGKVLDAQGSARPGHNMWSPAIAVSPTGQVAVAYDQFGAGDYDIQVHVYDASKGATDPRTYTIAQTPKFEARPSIVYDPSGRLWIAYEEGPELWGKDYGSLVPDKGNPLYSARSVRVVCLDSDGRLKRATADLPTSTVVQPARAGDAVKTQLFESGSRYAYPKLGLDGQGRVWLAYRRNFGSRYSSHAGPYWLTYARRLDGQNWSEPIEVHHSDGLLDHRPVLLPHVNGGLLIVHNTDGRYTTPEKIDNQIYASLIDLPARATVLQLVPHEPGTYAPTPAQTAENATVKRIRAHRVQAAGKTYQYLPGEYHRHTELSWDGAPDGSLEDMFRYAIDAAQMDWIGAGDHDYGAGREYPWWLTQKFTDAYTSKRFTAMHTYERSVAYPHGHRNVMFAQRGVMTLPRLSPPKDGKKVEGGVHPDDCKMLYRYLHEFGGICASHTSATGMGTDWRDNDPVVEPIVEIYQGDRMSYEMEGAPRAGYDPKLGKEPANVAGWFPKGFVNLALQKGYKLGFQASSDHWSTHISFFIILAEGRDRQQLLDAVKKRHCYAATDFIIADFRCGDRIMGDEVTVTGTPKFQIHVIGTNKLAKIDVLRDSEVVDSLKPGGKEFKGEWTDPAPPAGPHYYYLRVLQADDEIAWVTPIWVNWKK